MTEETQQTLQEWMNSPYVSIIISAVVVLMIVWCILTLFSKATGEKEIERRRWDKVSDHCALFDLSKKEWIFLEADEVLVGRHNSADIRFPDMSVSRYHATLYVNNGVWSVEDLGSRSGTMVNGSVIHSRTRLHDGDKISFGNKTVLLRQRGGR